MNKTEFLNGLDKQLDGHLNREEIKNAISYYDELLTEAFEAGRSEEETISSLGSVEDVAAKIKAEAYFQRAEKKGKMSGYLKAIIAILGVFAFPIAIPVVAVIFSLLVALFAIVVSIFAVALAIGVSSIVLIVGGIISMFSIGMLQGGVMLGSGMVLAGATMLSVLLCIKITQLLILLFGKIFKGIYKKLGGKGGAKK